MPTLDASGAGVVGEVGVRRRTAAAGITTSFRGIGTRNLPHHHEVLSIPAVSLINIHIDFGWKNVDE